MLYGIEKETHDIDLYGTPESCNRLISEGCSNCAAPFGGKRIAVTEEIEIFDDVDFTSKTLNTISGVNVAKIDDIEAFYAKMNRDKDQETLRKIKQYKLKSLD